MKKVLFITLAFCLFVFSCKKDHSQQGTNPPATGKKYAVKFNMNALTVSNGGAVGVTHSKSLFATKTRAVGDTGTLAAAGITRYYYLVYDASGKNIRRTYRDANTPGFETKYIDNTNTTTATYSALQSTATSDAFGAINDLLVTGTYTVMVLGIRETDTAPLPVFFIDGHNETAGTITYNPLSTAFFNYTYAQDALPNTYDTFLYKGSLTIGFQNVQQTLALTRVTAQLTIKAEDAVPANAASLQIVLATEDMGLNLNALTANTAVKTGSTVNLTFNPANVGLINTEYSCYVINTLTPIDVTFNCYDNANQLISSHTVSQVKFVRNQKTILSGQLFNPTSSNGVGGSTGADPGFAADSTVVNF